MAKRRANSSIPGLEDRLRHMRRRGFADGVASVLGGTSTGRPVRIRVHGAVGSLEEDWRELQRDGERLFDECS